MTDHMQKRREQTALPIGLTESDPRDAPPPRYHGKLTADRLLSRSLRRALGLSAPWLSGRVGYGDRLDGPIPAGVPWRGAKGPSDDGETRDA